MVGGLCEKQNEKNAIATFVSILIENFQNRFAYVRSQSSNSSPLLGIRKQGIRRDNLRKLRGANEQRELFDRRCNFLARLI